MIIVVMIMLIIIIIKNNNNNNKGWDSWRFLFTSFKTGTMEDVETMIILLIAIHYCLRLGRLAHQQIFKLCHEQKQTIFM
jgi:hypothetical protein